MLEKNHHLYGYKEIFITGLYNSIKYDSKCYWIAIRGRKEEGGFTIKHFVTPNFVQAVFGPKHWDIRLKLCFFLYQDWHVLKNFCLCYTFQRKYCHRISSALDYKPFCIRDTMTLIVLTIYISKVSDKKPCKSHFNLSFSGFLLLCW